MLIEAEFCLGRTRVRGAQSAVENGSAAYSNTIAARHEYFGHTGTVHRIVEEPEVAVKAEADLYELLLALSTCGAAESHWLTQADERKI